MNKEIYYVAFPAIGMMNNSQAIPFEVLDVSEDNLRIKLLEDVPLVEGICEQDQYRITAGTEYVIANKHRARGKLIDILRAGDMAAYYVSHSDNSEKHFAGTLFGYDPR